MRGFQLSNINRYVDAQDTEDLITWHSKEIGYQEKKKIGKRNLPSVLHTLLFLLLHWLHQGDEQPENIEAISNEKQKWLSNKTTAYE